MHIALFADIHGRILLSFKLCARWEQETGQKIDLILQAGDLGVFPDTSQLDRATRRFAAEDPTELGFSTHFAAYHPEVMTQLQSTTCPMIFVRGNHEDHPWLDNLEQQTSQPIFSIDPYQRIWCLKSGLPYTFHHDQESITLLGVGRVGQISTISSSDSTPLVSKASVKEQDQPSKYIQPYEKDRLNHLTLSDRPLDILLSHDSPRGYMRFNSGIDELGTILERYSPRYHFFGHYGGPYRLDQSSAFATTMCKLADLHWNPDGPGKLLNAGSMAILTWHNSDDHHLQILDQPWLKDYSAFTWEYL